MLTENNMQVDLHIINKQKNPLELPEGNIVELIDKLEGELSCLNRDKRITNKDLIIDGLRLIGLMKIYISMMIQRNAEQSALIQKVVEKLEEVEDDFEERNIEHENLSQISDLILFAHGKQNYGKEKEA